MKTHVPAWNLLLPLFLPLRPEASATVFYFHLGDESGIVLKRAQETLKKRRK
jgi:hypothetical protein